MPNGIVRPIRKKQVRLIYGFGVSRNIIADCHLSCVLNQEATKDIETWTKKDKLLLTHKMRLC